MEVRIGHAPGWRGEVRRLRDHRPTELPFLYWRVGLEGWRGVMVFVIGAVLVVVAFLALGLVLGRRGNGGLSDDTAAGRAPEEYRVPGAGGGNSGGFAG
jgi:hypothetical protein